MSVESEKLEQIIESIDSKAAEQLDSLVDALSASEQAFVIEHLDDDYRHELLELVSAKTSAEMLEHLPYVHAVQLIENSDPEDAAAIMEELPSDHQADLINSLDRDEAEAILNLMPREDADAARELAKYDDYVAGGLMNRELLMFQSETTVRDVANDFAENAEEYQDYQIQYLYITDSNDRLIGVLPLRNMLFAKRDVRVADIMIRNPISVLDSAELDELADFFESHAFLGVPVCNGEGKLLGVLQRSDVDEALQEQQESTYLKSQGITSGEEVRSMPLWMRAKGRLSWLAVNVVLNLMAAGVIASFESTLQSVITLAMFLPIISDMSGCSGNQAVAVSIRELMLGSIRSGDVLRVWLKEIQVGVLNGAVLGALLAVIAVVWKGNIYLGIVVGLALMLNTMVAVSIGGIVPLVLRATGRDPAVASGPLLTTVTDMCGFFLVLSFASAVLPKLI